VSDVNSSDTAAARPTGDSVDRAVHIGQTVLLGEDLGPPGRPRAGV